MHWEDLNCVKMLRLLEIQLNIFRYPQSFCLSKTALTITFFDSSSYPLLWPRLTSIRATLHLTMSVAFQHSDGPPRV